MPTETGELESLAANLGIASIPASWERHWRGFARCPSASWALTAARWIFDLPADSFADIEQALAAINTDSSLKELAEFWHYMIYHLPGEIGDNNNYWKMPDSLRGIPSRLFSLAVILSGTEHAMENFRGAGLDENILAATLGYIGYYVREVRRKRGVYGLESLHWLRNYVRAEVVRLGRLTVRESEYSWPFRAFRNRRTGEAVCLCDGRVRYRLDGLADGINGIADADAWMPAFYAQADGASGSPVAGDGRAVRQPIILPADQWQQVLSPGDSRIEVHIAGGCRLEPGECLDSLRQAIQFFSHSDSYPAVFTCTSWLLDPALAQLLPADANIVRFQWLFRPLPLAGDHRQTYDLVFGNPDADPKTFPRQTRLQRAIADYVSAGGEMRSAAGIILWSDALKLTKQEQQP